LSAAGLSILIAEDEAAHAEAILRSLRRDLPGADVRTTSTLAAFRAEAAARPPEAAVVDLNLPDGCAADILVMPPEEGPFPVVVMTAYGDERVAVEALKAGALEYVVKSPEAFSAMARTVQRVRGEWGLLRERRRVEAERRRLLAEAEARERRMAALVQATRAVLDVDDLFEVARRIFQTARAAVGADLGCVVLGGVDGTPGGFALAGMEGGVFPVDPAGLGAPRPDGTLLENGLPEGVGAWNLPSGPVSLRNALHASMKVGEKPVGRMVLANKRGGFTADDAALAAALAETMAVALARASDRKALEASEAKYRALFDSVNDAIIIRTIDGSLLEVNRAAVDLYGYSRGEFLRLKITDLSAPDSLETAAAVIRAIGRKGQAIFQSNHLSRDGRRIAVEINSRGIRYGGGPAVLSVVRDITERRRAEEALRASEEQLRQERKIDSIGRLAGGIAHDLNNLLVPILGYSEILRSRISEADPRWSALDQIYRAAERARDLTWRLLAFGRRQIFTLRPLDLRQVVEGFMKLLRRTIREDIEIRLLVPERLSVVRADSGQIEQVLMNLAVNAQDAMSQGGTLTLELADAAVDPEFSAAHPDVAPGDYVTLTVGDTGTGMDQTVLEQVFEPFFTTKEKGKGTGLGLPTVYGIVKQHGGSILLRSQPGQGTVVTVYLPVVAEEAAMETSAPTGGAAAPRGTEAILVVEDSEPVRVLACRMLEEQGYRVIAADSAESAPKALENAGVQPRLLLTDVVMPGCNGRELYRRMAASMPGLKVLFMSGYTENAIVHHGVLEDGIAFLYKPFTQATLAAKVREVLDGP